MTMDSLQAFRPCHNTTLLCSDLELNLSQYFTQQDKIAGVGAPSLLLIHSVKLFLR